MNYNFETLFKKDFFIENIELKEIKEFFVFQTLKLTKELKLQIENLNDWVSGWLQAETQQLLEEYFCIINKESPK